MIIYLYFPIENKKVDTISLEIEMDFEILSGAETKLLDGKVNLAITPFISEHSKIEVDKLCDIRVIPAVASKVFKNKRPQLKELLALPQIIVKDGMGKQIGSSFAEHSESSKWVVSDHHIKRELIINGLGWGHLEETSISKELQSKAMTEIKLKGLSAKSMPLYLARSYQQTQGPVSHDLWGYIVEHFKDKKLKR